MLVPARWVTRTPASSKALSTPIWAHPRTAPPERARPREPEFGGPVMALPSGSPVSPSAHLLQLHPPDLLQNGQVAGDLGRRKLRPGPACDPVPDGEDGALTIDEAQNLLGLGVREAGLGQGPWMLPKIALGRLVLAQVELPPPDALGQPRHHPVEGEILPADSR